MPKDGKPNANAQPNGRAPLPDRRRSGPRKTKSFVERATASGHSGYGSDSVRPHLRDQLRLKGLMPQAFPTVDLAPSKDDHHR